jgi:hypothetical protein
MNAFFFASHALMLLAGLAGGWKLRGALRRTCRTCGSRRG